MSPNWGTVPGDGGAVDAVESDGAQDGQQSEHQRGETPPDQDVLLQLRPQEVVRRLEAEVVGRHHGQQHLQTIDKRCKQVFSN